MEQFKYYLDFTKIISTPHTSRDTYSVYIEYVHRYVKYLGTMQLGIRKEIQIDI